MVQFVIKIVESLASLKSGMKGVGFLISLIKFGRESTEHVGEGKVSLSVSIVTRGVENKGFSL